MTSSPHDSPQVYAVPGRCRSRTSCALPIKVGPALLVPPDGSAHCTLVAAKLTSYLSLGHASIVQGKNRCPFSLNMFCVVPMVKMTKYRYCFYYHFLLSTGGIYRLSAHNPSAMGEVCGLITMPPKSKSVLKVPKGSTQLCNLKVKLFHQSYMSSMWSADLKLKKNLLPDIINDFFITYLVFIIWNFKIIRAILMKKWT